MLVTTYTGTLKDTNADQYIGYSKMQIIETKIKVRKQESLNDEG